MTDAALHAEAERLARYLVGTPAGPVVGERYARAVRREAVALAPGDEAVLRCAARRPRTLPLLDGGLALLRPHAELRRRLYLLFAILETTPEHHARFLPVAHGPRELAAVLRAGVRGALRGVAGAVLVTLVAR